MYFVCADHFLRALFLGRRLSWLVRVMLAKKKKATRSKGERKEGKGKKELVLE
jgi:hypothetical protein